jgi:hypothetical protein
MRSARMHLARSQSTGTAALTREQNNSSFRYKDAVTLFFRSGQV